MTALTHWTAVEKLVLASCSKVVKHNIAAFSSRAERSRLPCSLFPSAEAFWFDVAELRPSISAEL